MAVCSIAKKLIDHDYLQARGASAGFWWWPRRTFYMLPGDLTPEV